MATAPSSSSPSAAPTADRIAALTQSLLDAFRDGIVPSKLSRTFLIPSSAPSWRWTPSNQLLAALQGHELDPRGFQQWRLVGRRVKKGARAAYILGPRIVSAGRRKAGELEEKDEVSAEPAGLKSAGEVVGFFTIPVFSYEFTEGEPLSNDPRVTQFLTSLPLREVAEAWGVRVEATLPDHLCYGFFARGTDGSRLIGLNTDSLLTWAHELTHCADERRDPAAFEASSREEREAVAELGAATLLAFLGLEKEGERGYAWVYLQAQTKGDTKKALALAARMLDRTVAATRLILDTAAELAEVGLAA